MKVSGRIDDLVSQGGEDAPEHLRIRGLDTDAMGQLLGRVDVVAIVSDNYAELFGGGSDPAKLMGDVYEISERPVPQLESL